MGLMVYMLDHVWQNTRSGLGRGRKNTGTVGYGGEGHEVWLVVK
jgi:hypothetical protein